MARVVPSVVHTLSGVYQWTTSTPGTWSTKDVVEDHRSVDPWILLQEVTRMIIALALLVGGMQEHEQ